MPELPEVEVISQRLSDSTKGLPTIDADWIDGSHRGRYLTDSQERDAIQNQRIYDVRRRGKFILIYLEKGLLLSHNAMSGYWDSQKNPWTFDYVEGVRTPSERDVRVRLHIGGEKGDVLRFHDSRCFGSLRYYPGVPGVGDGVNPQPLQKLGPEIIGAPRMDIGAPVWDWDRDIPRLVVRPKRPIKDVLMDQNVVAGIGNIYATEGLYRAKVHPEKPAGDITPQKREEVIQFVKVVMRESLQSNIDYKNTLKCYRVDKCHRCQEKIQNVRISGRSSYFCPNCQRV